jgi:hypothetical protein
MTKLEALIEEARRLSTTDRRRLVAEVEDSLERDDPAGGRSDSYAPLLSLAGTAQSAFDDVSIDKYRHLALAVSPEPPDA